MNWKKSTRYEDDENLKKIKMYNNDDDDNGVGGGVYVCVCLEFV